MVYSPDSLSCEQGTGANIPSDSGATMVSNLANTRWIVNGDNPSRIYEEVARGLKNPKAKRCPIGK